MVKGEWAVRKRLLKGWNIDTSTISDLKYSDP